MQIAAVQSQLAILVVFALHGLIDQRVIALLVLVMYLCTILSFHS
jgi:hypothetical protein